jgi:hypothetical protein
VRIFKSKWFVRFADKEGISDAKLREVVKDLEAGKIDCDYGGGVIKQRIARLNEGKSGGYRLIILFRRGDKAFFVYGYRKSQQENIDKADLQMYKKAAKVVFAYSDDQLTKQVKLEVYKELECDG